MSFSVPVVRLRSGAQSSPLIPSRECLILLAICLLDTLSSAWLFHHNLASEANPLLLPYAQAGTVPFVLAKALTFLPALALSEWYRQRRPEFVAPLLRCGAILYAGIYSVLVLRQFIG